MKVEIKDLSYGSQESTAIYIDGQWFASGDYGSEPEDNTAGRAYSWVAAVMVALARKLGADTARTSYAARSLEEYEKLSWGCE